jgi:hypothetical protein
MKANKYMAILVASLAVTLTANADPIPGQSVLAGWYNFDGTSNSEAADIATVTATVNKGGSASSDGIPGTPSGSTDDFYGFGWPVNNTPPSAILDGRLNVVTGTAVPGVVFSLSTSSNLSLPINYMLFDAARSGGTNASYIKIEYRYPDAGPTWNPLPNQLPPPSGLATSSLIDGVDYVDFDVDLQSYSIVLSSSSPVDFRFTGENFVGGELKLDNILFTTSAIPEPGSMLALGCFLGSGLLIRRNRRSVA